MHKSQSRPGQPFLGVGIMLQTLRVNSRFLWVSKIECSYTRNGEGWQGKGTAGPTDVENWTPCSCYCCTPRKGEIGKAEQGGRDRKGKHYFLGPMCSTHCHSSLSCSKCHCGMAEVGSDLKKPQLLLWRQKGDGILRPLGLWYHMHTPTLCSVAVL